MKMKKTLLCKGMYVAFHVVVLAVVCQVTCWATVPCPECGGDRYNPPQCTAMSQQYIESESACLDGPAVVSVSHSICLYVYTAVNCECPTTGAILICDTHSSGTWLIYQGQRKKLVMQNTYDVEFCTSGLLDCPPGENCNLTPVVNATVASGITYLEGC